MISQDDNQVISVCFTSVKKCKEIITELIENTVLRSLVIIGKRQDQCKFFIIIVYRHYSAHDVTLDICMIKVENCVLFEIW